jgi:signal transduction histidine kinase
MIHVMSLPETLRRQPKWLVLFEALALVGIIGWLDHVTGWEWSFFAPFALPIALVAWKLGRHLGFACASLCALTFWVAHIGGNPYQTHWGFAVAVLGRWFYFTVFAVAVAGIKTKRELDRARIASLQRTEELECEILQVADQEKERLGRELHDGLCQTLAGISALSATLSRKLTASSESAAATDASEITKLLHDAISEARDLACGLGPLGLEEGGLDAALATLAITLQNQFDVTCSIECPRPFGRLPHEVALHLFRIVQEGVKNALAHGRAERIEISLSRQDGQGLLSVRDDGVGLPEKTVQCDGVGLHTMATRARLIGGTLELRRITPRGTAVLCTFSLPETPDTLDHPDHAPENK